MQKKPGKILLLISLVGLTAASVGLALADAGRKEVRGAAPSPGATLDCKALNSRLRTCAAHIATAVDAEVPDKLARMAPPLRSAVLSVMADELQARVGGACSRTRGKIEEGPLVAACMSKADAAEKAPCPASGPQASTEGCAAWRKGQACEAFSASLKTAFASLPQQPARPAAPRKE